VEETIGYEELFSAEEWAAVRFGEWTEQSRIPPLPEKDALRMAAGLDDYELVSVSDIGGSHDSGCWLTVRDERFGLSYEIASHHDYWDFLGYFCSGKQWPAKPLEEVA
jgi:hypothetical protein